MRIKDSKLSFLKSPSNPRRRKSLLALVLWRRIRMYLITKNLIKHFEKLCNLKKEKDIKQGINFEVAHTGNLNVPNVRSQEEDYYSRRLNLYNHLFEGIETSAEILRDLEYYRECLTAFQKMARQVANGSSSELDLSPLEVCRLNELLNFKIPPPIIQYNSKREKPFIKYPHFLPEEPLFPILAACTFFLCEIATGSVPYSLTTCDYIVPLANRKARKPCGKILLQHKRGRKRKWCASHRTYRSKQRRKS